MNTNQRNDDAADRPGIRPRAGCLLALFGLLGLTLGLAAADKNGVSPNSISLPKGPGSIEGLGDSFQPSLNTGTAKHGLGLKLPPGTAGHQPALGLAYEGGGGNGPLGYGWSVPLPHIQRRTDEGVPTYGQALGVDRTDTFINEAKEELVPTADGFFFCENEGSFVRYRSQDEHWEGTAPDGTRLEFGLTAAGRIEEPGTGRVFKWLLERETDTRGNAIEYVYRSFPGAENLNQKYLALVRYGPGAPPWIAFHFAAFEYEDRPDWFEDGRAGFLVRTGKRLRSISVATQGVPLTNHLAGDFNNDGVTDHLNRRYDLAYLRYDGDASHWSLLSKVTLVGADGITALPPATFDYAVSHPPSVIDASSNVWASVNAPNAVMDNPLVDLIDLNADGLPDVLKTDAGGGGHTVAVNRGPRRLSSAWLMQWADPVSVDPGNGASWNFDLASDRTHLADMDGDGLADLVHKTADDAVFYFPNRGRLSWGERRDMTLQETAPPAPFGHPGVRTADVDFDKRIDIIQSIELGASVGYRVWFNLGDQAYSPPITVEPEGGFDLALASVHVADCNGDRVPDIVRIQPGAVNVAAGLGYGRFAAPLSLVLPDITLDDLQVANAKLTDINGDGLADLVLERAAPGVCWYWLNLGNYTLDSRRRITGLPAVSSGAAVRWADLNGNGTTDLIYADSTAEPRLQMVELGQLLSGGLAPNLLTRIANGIGRVTSIEYAPSTQFAVDDQAADRPWPDSLPFPITVVAAVIVSDSLGHEYTTRFRYHDGYYDPLEKQFRGFAEVEQIDVGDPTAPTLVSRSHFDTGRAFDAMKGRLLQASSETEDGAVFSREITTWTNPPRLVRTGTNGLAVRFAHPVATAREILERGEGTPRRLETEMEYDTYGNPIRQSDYGIIEGGDRFAFDDERVTVTEYALNLDRWILRTPKRQLVQDENGVVIAKSESFYDDETFSGNNPGEVTLGNLTLRRDWIDPASPTNYVNAARTKYDSFGNPIALFDPLSDGSRNPAQGHFRELAYDEEFHSYTVRETIHVGKGSSALVSEGAYDPGLAIAISSTDFNRNVTRNGYDALGRLVRVVRPGDSEAYPTTEFDYVLAVSAGDSRVINYVETRQRDQSQISNLKSAMYLRSRQFTDGLGRALMTRTEAEPAEGSTIPRVVVSGVTLFNARLQPARTLNPFFTVQTGTLDELLSFEDVEAPGWQGQFSEGGDLVALDLATAHQSAIAYDATLRSVRKTNPDGTFARTEFEPLLTRVFDENDTDPASPHFDTPTIHFSDGLGRLIQLNELVRLNDDGTPSGVVQTWTTRYQFDLNDQLVRITDSQSNVKELRYDGLKRTIWMNDPNAGIRTNRYDAASNLIETIDAKGQRTTYGYDGANRVLFEDYDDATSSQFSYGRTPDIAFHYDAPRSSVDQGDGTLATARNAKGMLAWVEDTSGEEHTSFDERGRVEWTVKRIPDPVLSPTLNPAPSRLVSYKTAFVYDPMDRVTRMTYPDKDEVGYRFNARGLVEAIDGGPSGRILSGLVYLPSAQERRIEYGNGIRTAYAYDSRLRLIELSTLDPQRSTELIHFAYDLDPVSNLDAIHDQRPVATVPLDHPRRNSQSFAYDGLHRLTRVQYNPPNAAAANGGEIRYRYDRVGNMLAQTSDMVHLERGRPVADLGAMAYGGALGSASRIGRQPGDPPGPHALTEIRRSDTTRAFRYDDNGNMNEVDGTRYTWDFRDRLVAVEDDAVRADYRYDFSGRRVARRVAWKRGGSADVGSASTPNPGTTNSYSLYPGQHFEVRDHDQPVKYVFHVDTRVARITGSLSTTSRVQRLRLRAGWNLVSLAVTAADLRVQLESGHAEAGELVAAAFLWDAPTRSYVAVTTGVRVGAGSVLWIRSNFDHVAAVEGDYAEPMGRSIPAGGGYVSGAGLEVWPIDLPPGVTAWTYESAGPPWRAGFSGDLAPLGDLPALLAPGEALYISTDEPVELSPSRPTARIVYYHPDHLDSATVITDAMGQIVRETSYHPFGEPRHEERQQPMETHYGFAQKERDRESVLNYFEARYLAGGLSRFVTLDPKFAAPDTLPGDDQSSFLSDPQKMNLYAYARNNPLKYVDPSGLETDWAEVARATSEGNIINRITGGPLPSLSDPRMAAAVLRIPVDAVNVFFGNTPANAPDRGARTYARVTEWEHTKNVAMTFGGGKLLSWAGGKIFGVRSTAVATEGGSAASTSGKSLVNPHARTGIDPWARTAPGAPPPAPPVSIRAPTNASASGAAGRAAGRAAAADLAEHMVIERAWFQIFRPIHDALTTLIKAGVHPSLVTRMSFEAAERAFLQKFGTLPPGSL